ncbi:MAG TPA: helix-turn-helix transcriptional regulator [Anaerolineaceae bacterium]|nr:helix-turn-helix transcriptional regulator [Anaerolineaceae bacterium]
MRRHRRGWAMGNTDGEFQERHSPVTVSLLEPAVLILINDQPQHGYSLLAELAALGMRTLHPSVVYRTLREMEFLGWIQSTWDTDQTQGPPRRIYLLTDVGKKALQNWQQELGKAQEMIKTLINHSEKTERR